MGGWRQDGCITLSPALICRNQHRAWPTPYDLDDECRFVVKERGREHSRSRLGRSSTRGQRARALWEFDCVSPGADRCLHMEVKPGGPEDPETPSVPLDDPILPALDAPLWRFAGPGGCEGYAATCAIHGSNQQNCRLQYKWAGQHRVSQLGLAFVVNWLMVSHARQ